MNSAAASADLLPAPTITPSSRHLLSIDSLSRDEIEELLDLTDTFVEVGRRAIPKVPALRGRTVVSLFFEDSTRTRLSFDTAAKRLSADTMSFAVSSSSVNKGESVRDTIETIEAMGIDAVIVRHKSSGVPAQIARWTDAAVINAGDGWHQHPTQALLDAYTARSHLGSLEGRHVAIVGDISAYTEKSAPLRDFVRESNRGTQVRFVVSEAEL